jgi:putative transposase
MCLFRWWREKIETMPEDIRAGRRRSIRLKRYDYSYPAGYFVTICTHLRECLFGDISEGNLMLNAFGDVVMEEWQRTKQMRQNVDLDAFIVMPNHFHGILVLEGTVPPGDRRGTMHRAPTPQLEQFGKPTVNSIPTILRGFKSSVTLRVNMIRGTPKRPVWQRNYYEHVVRNETDLEELRQYIQNNPLKWLEDENHPDPIRKSRT